MKMSEPSPQTFFDAMESPESIVSSQGGRVRTSRPLARDWAWTANVVDYGARSAAFLANFDHDTQSWRTPQRCLLSTAADGSAEYSATWPRSGSMRNGIAYRLPALTRATSEIASGSCWRTATPLMPTVPVQDVKNDGGPSQFHRNTVPLNAAVKLLPTARASDSDRGGRGELLHTLKGAESPRGLLPTPTASRRSGLQSHGENALLGSLNPEWVEWYQGMPIGWTDLP